MRNDVAPEIGRRWVPVQENDGITFSHIYITHFAIENGNTLSLMWVGGLHFGVLVCVWPESKSVKKARDCHGGAGNQEQHRGHATRCDDPFVQRLDFRHISRRLRSAERVELRQLTLGAAAAQGSDEERQDGRERPDPQCGLCRRAGADMQRGKEVKPRQQADEGGRRDNARGAVDRRSASATGVLRRRVVRSIDEYDTRDDHETGPDRAADDVRDTRDDDQRYCGHGASLSLVRSASASATNLSLNSHRRRPSRGSSVRRPGGVAFMRLI